MIDACIHHAWPHQRDVMPYVSRGWREYMEQPVSIGLEVMSVIPRFPYHRVEGDKLSGRPEAGTTAEDVCMSLLDAHGVERGILSYDEAMYIPSIPNTHIAREVTRALNDWTVDRWLGADTRLYGLILVPNQVTEDAVAEIERLAGNDRMAGVLMAGNSLSKPFGHPAYHPIYAAAVAHDLPVVIHAGGDAISESLSQHAAGGLVATYSEYYVFQAHPIMSHIVSVISQGVFEKFPALKMLFVGAGVSWLPSLMWRFDIEYRSYRREAPWLKREPSEYLRDNVRLSTFPLETPNEPERLVRLLRSYDGIEDLLVYASGYPSWDTNWPAEIEAALPAEWHDAIFRQNALDLFRWGADVPAGGVTTTETRRD